MSRSISLVFTAFIAIVSLAAAVARAADEPKAIEPAQAKEHIDQMAGAEAFAGAVDGGERLDGGIRAVPGLDGFDAGVAVAAIAGMHLAEMGKDRLAAAVGRLADGEQRGEL